MLHLVEPVLRKPSRVAIGLMSGTSADGCDAALVRLHGHGAGTRVETIAFRSDPWPPETRAAILACFDGRTSDVCALNFELGEAFADACLAVVADAGMAIGDVDFVASHGQTVWHIPATKDQPGSTLQIGESAVIAERVGCIAVSDFRVRDIAAGGQGAPLVPFVDRLLFSQAGVRRAMLNIGGIGNTTLVDGDVPENLVAFDTGPGNSLIDFAARHADPNARFDRDGALAASGRVDAGLLKELLAHPYFAEVPPKSTGRELFGRAMFDRILRERPAVSAADFAATYTEFTGRTIAEAIARFLAPSGPIHEVVVSGGGAHNPVLMRSIAANMANLFSRPPALRTSAEFGIGIDAKEAIAFAVLGNETLHGSPGNVPAATGARHPAVLGKIALP